MKPTIVEAALRYAQMDKTDPFAFRRAMSHYANKVCNKQTDDEGRYAYDAEQTEETREYLDGYVNPDGSRTFKVTIFKNGVRP